MYVVGGRKEGDVPGSTCLRGMCAGAVVDALCSFS